MAGGIDLAEKHLGHGTSAVAAGIPGLQNRRKMFVLPGQRDRGATAIDHDHRLAGGLERLHKFLLHLRQFNRGPVEAFAFLPRRDAADIDDQVRGRWHS